MGYHAKFGGSKSSSMNVNKGSKIFQSHHPPPRMWPGVLDMVLRI